MICNYLIRKMGEFMTKKTWFQFSIGLLLLLIIIKFLVDVKWIFSPIIIISKTICMPILMCGVLLYISKPLQFLFEKWKVPSRGSMTIIFALLVGLIWIAISFVGPPIVEQVNNITNNLPSLINQANRVVTSLLEQSVDLPGWLKDGVDSISDSLNDIALNFGKWFVQSFQS